MRKLDYARREVTYTWRGTVIAADASCVVIRAPFATTAAHPPTVDGVPLLPGDVFTEYYYLDRWYNIFHVADPSGEPKGWYCNVAMPATVDDEGIAFVDLCLDLFVHPDGRLAVLDEEEFAALMVGERSADDVARARDALATLFRIAAEGGLPSGPGGPAARGG